MEKERGAKRCFLIWTGLQLHSWSRALSERTLMVKLYKFQLPTKWGGHVAPKLGTCTHYPLYDLRSPAPRCQALDRQIAFYIDT